MLWKYNQDNTGSGSFYIKGSKGLEYDIPEIKGASIETKITYSAKLSIILQGGKWSFNDIEDFKAFLMKRPELKRKFDFQTQESRET